MDIFHGLYQLLHHSPPNMPLSKLDEILLIIKSIISGIGSLVITMGVLRGTYHFFILRVMSKKWQVMQLPIDAIRRDLGRTITLGLEFIIAADVIETTTTPDYYSLGILAIIVAIRTFLSFTLNKEISEVNQNIQNLSGKSEKDSVILATPRE